MATFRGKIYNDNVFQKYLKTLESTKENALIKSNIFENVNKYNSKLGEQAGGFFITEPIKGRIGGEPVNYDGNTDITSNERKTFYQTKIAIGRANAWGENDFTTSITGENFMAEAQEVKDYWDGEKQKIALSMLKGIFNMSGNNDFATKHTYEAVANLTAVDANKAAQKALGDKKQNLEVMFMHSAVSTNLESLNLIEYLKYTDASGITRDLTIGTYNGKVVIVDDEMPILNGFDEAISTTAGALKVIATGTAEEGKITVANVKKGDFFPADVAADDYVVEGTKYTTYMFSKGFFEYEDLDVLVPSELARNAYTKGGSTDLISRIRFIIVPQYISYKTKTAISPTNANLENGANWEVANDGVTGDDVTTEYINDKLIPVVRILSRG